jgi:hypothetical protein
MLNLQDWLDEHESPQAMGGAIMYVRSDDVRALVSRIRQESQAAQYLQTVETGIIIHTTA